MEVGGAQGRLAVFESKFLTMIVSRKINVLPKKKTSDLVSMAEKAAGYLRAAFARLPFIEGQGRSA